MSAAGIMCKRKADYIASDITKAAIEAGLDPFTDIVTKIDGDDVVVSVVIT